MHSRARLSILLSNHICRCDAGCNRACEGSSVSLVIPFSWDQVTLGHDVTLQGASAGAPGCSTDPKETEQPGDLQQLCSGGFVVTYSTQLCEHSTAAAAGLGETQVVPSGRSHTLEADKASQATHCLAMG